LLTLHKKGTAAYPNIILTSPTVLINLSIVVPGQLEAVMFKFTIYDVKIISHSFKFTTYD